MDDAELNRMSLRELLELQAELHAGIRAAIRAKRLGVPMPASAGAGPAGQSLDLERERDAWLARKRSG